MISSVSAHGFKPHLVNGTNATNAAAARYLASLQLNGGGEFASSMFMPGQFVQQQQQQQHQHQNQAQNTHNKAAIQRLTGVAQESLEYGERSDGSVFVSQRSYQQAQPSYPPNTTFSQLRPAAADSRAHMHLQLGSNNINTISQMKEAPTDQRRFSTGANQWEDADPTLVAALYCKFFDGGAGGAAQADRRMSTGQFSHHGGSHHGQQNYHRMSGHRHGAYQRQQRRPYLPQAEELGPGWS